MNAYNASWKIFLVLALWFISACSGGGSRTPQDLELPDSDYRGRVVTSLTDAPTDDYKAIYITVDEVLVHGKNEHWETVASPQATYNLLELVDGVRKELGITDLEPGKYTQLRLILGDISDNGYNILSESHPYPNYLIDHEDSYHFLKTPSALHSGIKLVYGFTIEENETTELVLDFDAERSVVKAGKSGNYLLKPVIKVVDLKQCAYLTGKVTNLDGYALEGVSISAQRYHADAVDPKDRVEIKGATLTNEQGYYTILLESGNYTVVVRKSGWLPVHKSIQVTAASYTEDFILNPSESGTVCGEVFVSGEDADHYVDLSFRQNVSSLSGSDEMEIEILHAQVVNFGDYAKLLPEGEYTLVAHTFGKSTLEYAVTVIEEETVSQDIFFE